MMLDAMGTLGRPYTHLNQGPRYVVVVRLARLLFCHLHEEL